MNLESGVCELLMHYSLDVGLRIKQLIVSILRGYEPTTILPVDHRQTGFSDEFNRDGVNLLRSLDAKIVEVSRELGISHSVLTAGRGSWERLRLTPGRPVIDRHTTIWCARTLVRGRKRT